MLHRSRRLFGLLTQQVCASASCRLQHKTVYTRNTQEPQQTSGLRLVPLLAAFTRTRAGIAGRTGLPCIIGHSRCFHRTVAGHSGESGLSETEVKRRKEEIVDRFFEARELLDDARAAADTVYFNQDMKEAQEAVQLALSSYDNLLGVLTPEQRGNLVGSIGLKMEELKAQQKMIEEVMT